MYRKLEVSLQRDHQFYDMKAKLQKISLYRGPIRLGFLLSFLYAV